MLITDQGFRDAVTRAVAQAQRARDERDTCPFELEGCGRKGVLCAVTRRGMTLCRFCPACGWNTFGVQRAFPRSGARPRSGRERGGSLGSPDGLTPAEKKAAQINRALFSGLAKKAAAAKAKARRKSSERKRGK